MGLIMTQILNLFCMWDCGESLFDGAESPPIQARLRNFVLHVWDLANRNLMPTVDDPETRELLGDISRVSRSICKTIQSVEKIFDQMKT